MENKKLDYIIITYKFKGIPTTEEKSEVVADMFRHGFAIEKISKTYIKFIKFY